MAELSDSDIQHLARLARLDLTTEEIARYADQLTSVVQYVDSLSEVDTSKVKTRTGVTGLINVVMADEPVENDFDREKALASLPRRDGNFIEVRAVLGGEVEAA
jgi:aspartyl-tRNA(Asn)/glutamyl-tRNA(Gln) amidotransferase subunit C